MKLKSLIVAAFLTLSTSAFAQWFPGVVQVSVLPGQVAFRVVNPNYRPIICSGQVFGQTIAGPVYTTYFVEQYLVPGDVRFAYVVATPFAPFATGWANIHCRFAWY